MDVLSVSCKQPADLSPWHGVCHEQGLLLKGAGMWNCLPVVNKARGIHSTDMAAQQDFFEISGLTPSLEYKMSGT